MTPIERHERAIRSGAWRLARIRAGIRGAKSGTFFDALGELDDARSDLVLAVLQAMGGFDASRGDEGRFVAVVIRNTLVSAIRSASREVGLADLYEHSAVTEMDEPLVALPVREDRKSALVAWASGDDELLEQIAMADGVAVASVRQRAKREAARIRACVDMG